MKMFRKLAQCLGECADKLETTADRIETVSKQTLDKSKKDNADAKAVFQALDSLTDDQLRAMSELFNNYGEKK